MKKKRLPKELTTVTPFSKFIALCLFAILPFAGFLVGMKYQAKLDSMNPTPTIDATNLKADISANSATPISTNDTTNWKAYKSAHYEVDLPYVNPSGGYQITPDGDELQDEYEYSKKFSTTDPNHWLLVIAYPKDTQLPLQYTDWNVFGGNFIPQLNQISIGKTSSIFDPMSKKNYSFTRLHDINVEGLAAKEYDSTYTMQNGAHSRYVVLQNGDTIYVITFESDQSAR